jgi:alkanesulfonate monooxygenase SsuD/methylene tetrahydromethanopterin reductase-like flavin-dependent oxidoreductase (luciferase family)
VAAGTPDEVWAGLERYFAAGCTRVLAVAFPRARPDVERMIRALGPRAAALNGRQPALAESGVG